MCEKCEKCDDLITNHTIIIDNQGGLFPHKRYIKGVKCGKFGQTAYSIIGLPTSKMGDVIVYK